MSDACPSVTADPASAHKPVRLTRKSLFAWAIGNFGTSLTGNAMNALVRPLFNTGFGMDSVLVSWALFFPLIVGAFLDPILGHISDTTHSRWGRRRPFILIGSLGCAFLLIAIWWMSPDWGKWVQFAYLGGACLLFGVFTSLYGLPLGALGYELTDDYHERTKMNAVVIAFTVTPFFIASWLYWLALRPALGGEVSGVRWISIFLGTIVAISGLVPVIFCRERFQHANQHHLKIWKSIATTFKNVLFRRLVFIQIFLTLGTQIFGGMLFYVNVFYICGGDKSLATKITGIGGTLYTIVALAQLPFITAISRRLGKTTGLRLGLGILLATTLLQPFVQNPHYPYLQIVTTVLAAPAFTLCIVFLQSFMPDLCDIDEVQTGLRREGTFGAVGSFVQRVEYSLVSLVVGYLVAFAGFDQLLSHQTPEVLSNLRWFSYLPNFLFTLFALLLAWNFPITETMMKEVRLTLDARRDAQPAS